MRESAQPCSHLADACPLAVHSLGRVRGLQRVSHPASRSSRAAERLRPTLIYRGLDFSSAEYYKQWGTAVSWRRWVGWHISS